MSSSMKSSTAWRALPAFLLMACADAPGIGAPSSDGGVNLPSVAVVECLRDGSTEVRTPQVLVQPDGVHLRVVNHLDEAASLNGWGMDVDPGPSRHVSGVAPGTVETACWPFSDHGSGIEPSTHSIEILDPDSTFVDGEVQCAGQAMSWVADHFTAPDPQAGRVPLHVARSALRGLEDDDEIGYSGYPSAEDPSVIVVRDGEVVASLGFARFDGEWSSPGGTICADTDIHLARGV